MPDQVRVRQRSTGRKADRNLLPFSLTFASGPLAPQVEKTSLPWLQDFGAVSISTTGPILNILPQAFSLAPYRTFSVIRINIFADFDPVLVDIPIVRTDIFTLSAAAIFQSESPAFVLPSHLHQQHRS